MPRLNKYAEFISGTPQFRISENRDDRSPAYTFYSQTDLLDDLLDIESEAVDGKQVRTYDKVNTLSTGDVVFSLISGSASIVKEKHIGYLYTQNYIKLKLSDEIEPHFLVYLLNEDRTIKKQFQMGLQGSVIMKYTLKQLKNLRIPPLPSLDKQKIIGDIYAKQLRLQALRKRAANLESAILLHKLEEGARI